MKDDEGGITHMAKAKFSKGFELIGEHLLPLQKCERGAGAGGQDGQGKLRAQVEIALADVSGLSDKISFYSHFFAGLRSLLTEKWPLTRIHTYFTGNIKQWLSQALTSKSYIQSTL
jgi:hypothetical protein